MTSYEQSLIRSIGVQMQDLQERMHRVEGMMNEYIKLRAPDQEHTSKPKRKRRTKAEMQEANKLALVPKGD